MVAGLPLPRMQACHIFYDRIIVEMAGWADPNTILWIILFDLNIVQTLRIAEPAEWSETLGPPLSNDNKDPLTVYTREIPSILV